MSEWDTEYYEEEPDGFGNAIIPETYSLCGCGCERSEHDQVTGRCLYCFEEDCGGFEEDLEATVMALALMKDRQVP